MAVLPEDALIAALASRQPQVLLPGCKVSVDEVFRRALKKERRLLAVIGGYQFSYPKKGVLQMIYDYTVTLSYQETAPENLAEVLVDDGSWDISDVLSKGVPEHMLVVTDDPEALNKKFSAALHWLIITYEGLFGWHNSMMQFTELSKDSLVQVNFQYMLPPGQLQQLQHKAGFAAESIWRTLLGRAQVPQFVKPFLALSYLAQECAYDQKAFDAVAADSSASTEDAAPHLAYGPLVEKRGICGGFAWAFKRLMDAAGIPCLCVEGYLREDQRVGHMWNLVKLDGQYYHVDPTSTIQEEGVYIRYFMRPDSFMKATHIWDETKYPPARGMRFNYEFLEDFLVENGTAYLDDGAAEQYMFPEDIAE